MVVRTLKNIIFMMAALTWLPMSLHCQLEAIPGLEFLACVTQGSCHNDQGAKESKPDTSDCCALEKSQYKTEKLRVSVSPSELQPVDFTCAIGAVNSLPVEVSLGILTAAPPELPQTWQFSSRTALPARAPSLLA